MTASQKIHAFWEKLLHTIKNFDWFTLLVYQERIAGLAIDDRTVRYVALEVPQREASPLLTVLASENLPEGVIEKGCVKNFDAFVAVLAGLKKKIQGHPLSLVLAIPSSMVFTTIFQFPRSLNDEQVEEALTLNVSYVLPVLPEQSYLDSHKIESTRFDKQEVFVALVEKTVVDPYLLAAEHAGFSVVATEPLLLSIMRLMRNEDVPVLLLIPSNDGVSSAIIYAGGIRFSELLPFREEIKGHINASAYANIVEREAQRMVGYDAAESFREGRTALTRIVLFDPYSVLPKDICTSLATLTGKEAVILKEGSELLIPRTVLLQGTHGETNPLVYAGALGAAERGILDRGEDKIVSLMPIGTEEAYEERRAISFAHFLKDLIYGLAVMFLVILGGTYGLLYWMGRSASTDLTRAALPQNIIELQGKVQMFDQYVQGVAVVAHDSIAWSRFLREFIKLLNPGVTIHQIRVGAPHEPIQVTLFAATNGHLLQYKRQLEDSHLFEEVKIPFAALAEEDTITFSVSLMLKDPNIIRNSL